jgi:PAS domain S-box-containing protein
MNAGTVVGGVEGEGMNNSNSFWSAEQANILAQLMLTNTQQYLVVFYDNQLRITGWSEGASFMTGWTTEEVRGQPITMLFAPEDQARKIEVHEANAARILGASENERWHVRKDGSRYWGAGAIMNIVGDDGTYTGYVKVIRDFTHFRTRMKYLENVQQECAFRREEKNQFIGTIAHEMRNPLSPLKMSIQLIKQLPHDHQRHGRAIGVMERQISFLERLVEDLVDLTRIQSGKMNLAYEPVVLQEFLTESVDSCQGTANAKSIDITQVHPQVPIRAEIDPSRLNQVVVNLVNNAVKYTPVGGHIWVSSNVDQTHCTCKVMDNGQGIDGDLLPKIFDIFTQADHAGTERGAGLGIGLAVVKEIVTLHQGTIEVRSEGPGKGSEFTVRIPLARPYGSEPEPFLPRDVV